MQWPTYCNLNVFPRLIDWIIVCIGEKWKTVSNKENSSCWFTPENPLDLNICWEWLTSSSVGSFSNSWGTGRWRLSQVTSSKGEMYHYKPRRTNSFLCRANKWLIIGMWLFHIQNHWKIQNRFNFIRNLDVKTRQT